MRSSTKQILSEIEILESKEAQVVQSLQQTKQEHEEALIEIEVASQPSYRLKSADT